MVVTNAGEAAGAGEGVDVPGGVPQVEHVALDQSERSTEVT